MHGFLFLFSGEGETTGVAGEGIRLGGGAHSSQSGGKSCHHSLRTDYGDVFKHSLSLSECT